MVATTFISSPLKGRSCIRGVRPKNIARDSPQQELPEIITLIIPPIKEAQSFLFLAPKTVAL